MESSRLEISALLPALLGLAFSLFLLSLALKPKNYINEPLYILPKVPVFGHVLGMMKKQARYLVDIYETSGLDIYTIPFPGLPGGKAYVANSPEIYTAMQRIPAKISMRYVETLYTPKLAGLSPSGARILAEYVNVGESQPSYLKDGIASSQRTLMPGESLTTATRLACYNLATAIGNLKRDSRGPVDLWSWVASEVMSSATNSFYGPNNPYKDPDVVKAYHDFQDNASGVVSYPYPKYTCAKAYAARSKIIAAFMKYYSDGGSELSSSWVQSAAKVSAEYQVSASDIASMDVANTHGLVANSMPSGFWVLYHVFNDEKLLAEVRAAIMHLLTTSESGGVVHYELDVRNIREVPILRSVFHEVLRYYSRGAGSRLVVEDTTINNRYLLKKGTFIFMPHQSYHFNKNSWGPNANEFDPRRFMDTKQPAGAFIAFGGGQSLCPGRFFAQNQVLSICAMMALRFDVKPAGGAWVHPGSDEHDSTINVHPPIGEVMVHIRHRETWQDGVWRFRV